MSESSYPGKVTVCEPPITVAAPFLQLADVVKLGHGPYDYATVKKITETDVVFFRPYVATESFSHTGGVICYVGIEEFSVPKSKSNLYQVFQRKTLA